MIQKMSDIEMQVILDAAKRGEDGLPGPHEVLDAIDQWRELDLRGSSAETVSAEFQKLFSMMINSVHSTTLSAPHSFYRIRRSRRLLSSVDDFGAPPVESAKKSRCGFDGLPMLYLSEDGMTPFEELGVPLHEQVYMVKYGIKPEEKLDLRYPFARLSDDISSGPSEKWILAERIMREFVRSEFIKPVGDGTEFLYNATASICWFLRTRASGNADGILYPSITLAGHYDNVALYPNSQSKVEIVDVRIVELVKEDEWISSGRDLASHFHPSFGRVRQRSSRGRILLSKLNDNPLYVNCCFRGHISGQNVGWEPCTELGSF
jgi:hypothetical protein